MGRTFSPVLHLHLSAPLSSHPPRPLCSRPQSAPRRSPSRTSPPHVSTRSPSSQMTTDYLHRTLTQHRARRGNTSSLMFESVPVQLHARKRTALARVRVCVSVNQRHSLSRARAFLRLEALLLFLFHTLHTPSESCSYLYPKL